MSIFSGTIALNKKVLLIVGMTFMLAGAVSASSINGEFEGNPIVKVKQNGKELNVEDVPAVIINGRTMVPIYMLKQLGVNVIWDSNTYSVDVNTSDRMNRALNWLYNNHTTDITFNTAYGGQNYEIQAFYSVSDGNYLSQFSTIKDILYNLSLTNAKTFRLYPVIFGNYDSTNWNYDKKILGIFSGNSQDVLDYYNGKITESELFGKLTYVDYTHKGNENVLKSLVGTSNSSTTSLPTSTTTPPQSTPTPTSLPVPPTSSTIESKIDGDFEGYDSDKVYKLMNGQIWKQTSVEYHYHYAFMPDVIIYNSGGVYKMKVDGMDDAVTVERLK